MQGGGRPRRTTSGGFGGAYLGSGSFTQMLSTQGSISRALSGAALLGVAATRTGINLCHYSHSCAHAAHMACSPHWETMRWIAAHGAKPNACLASREPQAMLLMVYCFVNHGVQPAIILHAVCDCLLLHPLGCSLRRLTRHFLCAHCLSTCTSPCAQPVRAHGRSDIMAFCLAGQYLLQPQSRSTPGWQGIHHEASAGGELPPLHITPQASTDLETTQPSLSNLVSRMPSGYLKRTLHSLNKCGPLLPTALCRLHAGPRQHASGWRFTKMQLPRRGAAREPLLALHCPTPPHPT